MNNLVRRSVRTCLPRPVRNWLRAPARSAAWVWDEFKHLVRVDQVIELRPGFQVRCHPAAYHFAYYAQAADPEQIAEFDSFIAHCQAGMTLYDLGAHFGIFSLAALHYGGTRARSLAVDPAPMAARMLAIQAQLNQVGERLTVVQAAVGERAGWQHMVAVGVLASGYFLTADADHPASEQTLAPAITLDQLVHETGSVPTHVKLDVEGAEAAALRGGSQVLAQAAPLLFLELHNRIIRERQGDPAETLALLDRFGYQTFALDGAPLSRESILNRPLIRIVARKEARR